MLDFPRFFNTLARASGLNTVESLELLAKKVTEHAKETARVHRKLKIQHPELELKVIVEEGDKEVKK